MWIENEATYAEDHIIWICIIRGPLVLYCWSYLYFEHVSQRLLLSCLMGMNEPLGRGFCPQEVKNRVLKPGFNARPLWIESCISLGLKILFRFDLKKYLQTLDWVICKWLSLWEGVLASRGEKPRFEAEFQCLTFMKRKLHIILIQENV